LPDDTHTPVPPPTGQPALTITYPGGQGNRIINPLKKKRKKPIGTEWRGIMDIRTELSLIPDPRIDRCKKHMEVLILP
jgi:hypothetical protein